MKLTLLFLYLFILSLSLGQFGAVSFSDGAANLYLSDGLLVSLLLVWFLESLLAAKSLRVSLRLAGPIFLFAVVGLASLLAAAARLSLEQWLVSSFYWLRWVLYALLFFVVDDLKQKRSGVALGVIKVLLVSGVVLALSGFIQFIFVPDFGLMAKEFGWDPHRNRLLSAFFDPNFTGAFLAMTLTLVLATALPPSRFRASRPEEGCVAHPSGLMLAMATVLASALFLTFSRSAWLLLGVVVGVLGLLRWRFLLLLSLLLAFLAYFLVPRVQTRLAGVTDPADSAHFRLLSWQKTVEIARDYFWTGVGFNAFRYAQADYGFFDYRQPLGGHAGAGSDSSWLLVLATTGIFGFLSYVFLYGVLLLRAWAKRREAVGLALLAVLVGLTFEANFINSLFFPPIMAWLWAVAGLL